MWPDVRDIDLEATTRDKVLYVAVALPVLGLLGGVLRASGLSQQMMLMIVLPLLCVSFVAWHLGRAIQRARRADVVAKQDAWRLRRSQSTRYQQPPRIHARPE